MDQLLEVKDGDFLMEGPHITFFDFPTWHLYGSLLLLPHLPIRNYNRVYTSLKERIVWRVLEDILWCVEDQLLIKFVFKCSLGIASVSLFPRASLSHPLAVRCKNNKNLVSSILLSEDSWEYQNLQFIEEMQWIKNPEVLPVNMLSPALSIYFYFNRFVVFFWHYWDIYI